MEQSNNEENLQGLLLPAMSTEHSYDDEEDERSAWETPVRNLDTFFTSMYHYHNNKGLPTILLSESCAVISLGFTTAFSTFLIGFVDWSALKHCHDESSCGSVSMYIISHPFKQFSTVRNMFIIVYSILLITFWCWRSFHATNIIRRAITMETFYREKLGILMNDLNAYSWDDVVERLIKLHDSNIHRVAVKDKLTVHDVVLRIMRKENFMIGLINQNILDLRVPWWVTPFISEKLFLTKSLEWSLSFCIMEYMFNDQFNISTLFLKDVNGLQGRFIMVGLIHLALLPFMLIFMSISFFLQNAQTFHSNKAYLGPRQWSPLALWTFREFNELPHIFETRMNRSYNAANEYINYFQNENLIVLAKTSTYISGAFIATFLLISVISEGVFLFVLFGEHNLLWWLGIFSAIYAGSRSIIPDETKIMKNPELLMKEMSCYTHYYPIHWQNQSHTLKVRNELASELFPFKIKLFFMEICSVVLTPLILCFSLPHCTTLIIEFVRDHARYVEGVGAVCDFALFDFDRYGDTTFGAPLNGYMDSSQRAKRGKMEQSFLNFQQAHPQWAAKEQGGGHAAKAFLEKLEVYKANQRMERENHIHHVLQQSLSSLNNNNTHNNNNNTANNNSNIANNNNNNTSIYTHYQHNNHNHHHHGVAGGNMNNRIATTNTLMNVTGSPTVGPTTTTLRGVFTGYGGGVTGYGNGFSGFSSPKTNARLTLQQQQQNTFNAGISNRKWSAHGYTTNITNANNTNSANANTANTNGYSLLPTTIPPSHDDDDDDDDVDNGNNNKEQQQLQHMPPVYLGSTTTRTHDDHHDDDDDRRINDETEVERDEGGEESKSSDNTTATIANINNNTVTTSSRIADGIIANDGAITAAEIDKHAISQFSSQQQQQQQQQQFSSPAQLFSHHYSQQQHQQHTGPSQSSSSSSSSFSPSSPHYHNNNNNNNIMSTTGRGEDVHALLLQQSVGSYLPSIPTLSRQNSNSLLQSDILLHSNNTTNNFTTMYGNSTLMPINNNGSSNSSSVNVSNLLRSILNQENIDYENDFYWLSRFHTEQQQQQ